MLTFLEWARGVRAASKARPSTGDAVPLRAGDPTGVVASSVSWAWSECAPSSCLPFGVTSSDSPPPYSSSSSSSPSSAVGCSGFGSYQQNIRWSVTVKLMGERRKRMRCCAWLGSPTRAMKNELKDYRNHISTARRNIVRFTARSTANPTWPHPQLVARSVHKAMASARGWAEAVHRE